MRFSEQLEAAERIVIYGARLMAMEAGLRISSMSFGKKLVGFAVSNMAGNPASLVGLPVREMAAYNLAAPGTCVVVAMRTALYREVRHSLAVCGVNEIAYWSGLRFDNICSEAWMRRFEVATAIDIIGEHISLPLTAEWVAQVRPKARVRCTTVANASVDSLILVDINPMHDREQIDVINSLWDRGCRNIMEFEYLPLDYAIARGGDIFLKASLYKRKVWRKQAKAVLCGSRLVSREVAHEGESGGFCL